MCGMRIQMTEELASYRHNTRGLAHIHSMLMLVPVQGICAISQLQDV